MSILTSIGKITLKTGGGGSASSCTAAVLRNTATETSPRKVGPNEWVMSPEELDDRADALIGRARAMLEASREQIWQQLRKTMGCQIGEITCINCKCGKFTI